MSRTHIAVGVIFNPPRDRVLLSRRPDHVSHAGQWEFPGGKLETGESARAALRRELAEELGLVVRDAAPLCCVDHDYPDNPVRLDVWSVTSWEGEAHGREGQETEWVPLASLWQRAFPEANRAIVRWLCLPPVYVVTPDLPAYDRAFLSRLETLITAGARMLQFRGPRSAGAGRLQALREVAALCAARGVDLMVNGTAEEAQAVGARGLHLNSGRLMAAVERPPDRRFLIAASVHNQVELDRAVQLDVDFAVLGPVAATASHPDCAPLGWDGFEVLARRAGRPVYAIGGMLPADLERAKRACARGLAMIRGVWEAEDPAAVFRACSD